MKKQNIVVVGKTNPFIVKVATTENPFEIDDFFEILDTENNNPICRIIKSENISIHSLNKKSHENDWFGDVEKSLGENKDKIETIYIGIAKIESNIKKPILAGSKLVIPTFKKVKPYIVKPDVNDSFILGEINGTNSFYNSLPNEYKNLFMVRRDTKMISQTSVPFLFDYKKLVESPHVGLFGGSGSGKTFALKVLIEEFMSIDVPMVVFDPHIEMNFKNIRDDIPDELKKDFSSKNETFILGKNIGINFSEILTDELINIMEFSGEMSGAMKNFMREIHSVGDSYSLLMSRINILIKLSELNDSRRLIIGKLSPEEKDLWERYSVNIPGTGTLIAVSWRLNSLNSEGIFNNSIDGLIKAINNQKVCILRGEMKGLNILGSYLLSKMYYKRKKYVDSLDYGGDEDRFLPFVIAMDEAHIFCPRNNELSPIKNILKTISQEGRKYGVFEVFATQRPSLLDETVVAQISNKFIFKLSIKEDLNAIKKETDLSEEELDRLPYLNSGEAFVSSSLIGKTASILIRYNITTDKSKINPFEEVKKDNLSTFEKLLLDMLPINNLNIGDKIEELENKTKIVYSVSEINMTLDRLAMKNKLSKEKNIIGTTYLK